MKKPKKIYRQKLQVEESLVNKLEALIAIESRKDGENHPLLKLILDCMHEESSLQQTALIKEVGKALQSKEYCECDPAVSVCLQILSEIFTQCDAKNPARHALASTLDGLSDSLRKLACEKLGQSVIHKAGNIEQMNTGYCVTPVVMRGMVDTISSLMENFKLGEEVIKNNGRKVLQFLSCCLQCFVAKSSFTDVPTEQTTRMMDCLVTTKTIIAVIQNCKAEAGQTEAATSPRIDEECIGDLKCILTELICILNNDFIPDCQTASGMAICLVLSVILGSDKLVLSIIQLFFLDHCHGNKCNGNSSDGTADFLSGLVRRPDGFSHLCLCHGLLTMLPVNNLIEKVMVDEQPITLLFDVLFQDLYHLCKSVKDPTFCLQSFRVLALWTEQARNVASSTGKTYTQLLGLSPIPQKLLSLVWSNWDHPTEGVRHVTKAIFENVVAVHVSVSTYVPTEDRFLECLAELLIDQDWHVRGKYGPLCCIASVLGAKCILGRHPGLPSKVLAAMNDKNIAPHAMDFIEKMSFIHKEELISSEKSLNDWFEAWVGPVLVHLCGDYNRRVILTQHCLPKLLKCCPESLHIMITQLQSAGTRCENVKALVTCLKTARSLGLVKVNEESWTEREVMSDVWGGVVSVDVLQKALCHTDDQCRLDALGLLCDSPRTTESVSVTDMRLLKTFLQLNINSQSPSFRQQSAALLKKLLLRMREGVRLSVRNLDRDKNIELHKYKLHAYTRFLQWYSNLLFSSLFPGASFARLTTSLHGLKLLASIFTDSDSKYGSFHFHDVMHPCNIRGLMKCFSDTYDVNKQLAYDLLTSCPRDFLPFQSAESLEPLLLMVEQLVTSPRAVDASTASVYLKILVDRCMVPLYPESATEYLAGDPKTTRISDNPLNQRQAFSVLSALLSTLTSQASVANESLVLAAARAPMHGAVFCLRTLLTHVNLRNVESAGSWKHLVSRLLTELFVVAELVFPVVTSSSPEGHVIDDSINDDVVAASAEKSPVFTPSSQALLVCCWRTMKEVALLLGDLVQNVSDDSGLLTADQVKRIGDFFTAVLLTSKHRGAFELAYTGFMKLCEVLWRCRDADLRGLPLAWLDGLMSDISTTVPSDFLSGTRRSAGVPFFVQAVVTTEPFAAGKASFKRVMRDLLHAASLPVEPSLPQDSSLPQVHSRNILRALYRDTRLGEDVSPFVADGLIASISGFTSSSWAVRNSSTLLFSALVTRVFGVAKAKDDHSRRNCMTGREFFSRYPSMHPFLLKHLEKATEFLNREESVTLHPCLYPVLVLLSRLYPSSMDGVDSTLNMSPFIPYVIRCAGSAVMKTRLMAARAIVPLVSKDCLVQVLERLLHSIPPSRQSCRQNVLHGTLLQILHLLLHLAENRSLSELMTSDVMPMVEKIVWTGTKENPCYLTRAVFLDIAHTLINSNPWAHGDSSPVAEKTRISRMRKFITNIASEVTSENSFYTQSVAIGDVFLKEIAATICLNGGDETEDLFTQEGKTSAKEAKNSNCKRNSCEVKAVKFTDSKKLENVSLHSDGIISKKEDSGNGRNSFEMSILEKKNSIKEPLESSFRMLNLSEKSPVEVASCLLDSPEYEVRLLALDTLSRKAVTSASDIPKDDLTQHSPFRGREIQAWHDVTKSLLEMAMGREQHVDCLSKVYEVLALVGDSSRFPETIESTCCITFNECWQYSIQLALKPGQRDSVRCAILAFLSSLVPQMYESLAMGNSSEEVTSYLDLVKTMSAVGESLDVRLQTAEVFSRGASRLLLLDPQNKLGCTPLEFWDIVVFLLHDDDPGVKETMAEVMTLLYLQGGDYSSVLPPCPNNKPLTLR
ncbi:thyroid adenoma-associated protein homolog isoform X2 [Nematostella vectensis]|uniref:thyroid adenoma-associated protein homolog isoform X2 n=1 Tax=Nematostella vectensis TaxID=45351 RepID=UPI002076DA2B|nr:thyroid adenoma-associated protein homolog isoform X2 [Nematostella vectensis]